MTLSELSHVGTTLVVFLNNLWCLQIYLRHAHIEVAVFFYIISKLLPRFVELSDIFDKIWQQPGSLANPASATSPPQSTPSPPPWLQII